MVLGGKKLLVLDVNGLLLATYPHGKKLPDHPPDARVNKYRVYKRPGCEGFLQFCLENFIVGIWSSAREENVISLVDYIFKEFADEARNKLAFVWHQWHCSTTHLRDPENPRKPLYLKELAKLWDRIDPHLPWQRGDYGPWNTVLIDDSPQKAIWNPPYTGIFPQPYKAIVPEDNYLLAGGEFHTYLQGLARAWDVQVYVKENPFGMPMIIPRNLVQGFSRRSVRKGSAKSKKGVNNSSSVATSSTGAKSTQLDNNMLSSTETSNTEAVNQLALSQHKALQLL